MMSQRSEKPKTLQDLLGADREQLRKWSDDNELRDPEHVEAEERFLHALFENEHEQPVVAVLSRWWRWYDWLTTPSFYIPALMGAVVLCMVLWMPWSSQTHRSSLYPKGRTKAKHQDKPLYLHLGRWQPARRMIKRVGNNDLCPPGANIFFGFTINREPGYVYLFVQRDGGRMEHLYPEKRQKHRRWKQGFHNLEVDREALSYKLPAREGRLVFVALKSRQKLPPHQLHSIRSRRSLQSLLNKYRHRARQSLAYHAITVRVRSP